MNSSTIGLIGVGALGLAMSEALIKDGRKVVGYRRSAMDDFTAAGGIAAGSSREVAEQADVILVCLPGDDGLDDVLSREDGPVPALGAGKIVVETTTASPAAKRRARDRVAPTGAAILDCPISGTPAMMRGGRAATFASGDRAAFDACRAVLETFAPSVTYVGEYGSGTVAKYVANLIVGIHNLAAAEALAFAAREGADPKAIHEAISGSVASSGMFELRGALMVGRDYSMGTGRLSNFLKNYTGMVKEANSVGALTPLSSVTAEIYAAAVEAGFDGTDQARVFEYMMEGADGGSRKD